MSSYQIYSSNLFPLHVQYINIKSLLCLVCWPVLVFVIAPIGSVYAHFIADDIAIPLVLDNTWKPSQVLWCIKGNACG